MGKQNVWKRILALGLALAMAVTAAPTSAWATEATTNTVRVYVFAQFDQTLNDASKAGLGLTDVELNNSGWYTIGYVEVASNEVAAEGKEPSSELYNNAVEAAKTSLTRYDKNTTIDITKQTDGSKWVLGSKWSNNGYSVDFNKYTWHLDITMPSCYCVTFTNSGSTVAEKYAYTTEAISGIPTVEAATAKEDTNYTYTYAQVWKSGDDVKTNDQILALRTNTTLTAANVETKTEKATAKVAVSVPETIEYGTAVNPTITADEHDGAQTVTYTDANGKTSETAPTALGDYTVTVSFAGTSTYKPATASADFSIVAKTVAVKDVTLPNRFYTGSEITLTSDAVKLGGKTLKAGTDYTIGAYTNNTALSTEDKKATVELTFQGNYSGTVTVPFNIVKNTMLFVTNVDNKNQSDIPLFKYIGQLAIEDEFFANVNKQETEEKKNATLNEGLKKYVAAQDASNWDSIKDNAASYKSSSPVMTYTDAIQAIINKDSKYESKNVADYKVEWYVKSNLQRPKNGFEFYSDEGYHIDGIIVEKATRTASLTMANFEYGKTAATPSLTCETLDGATPVYYYKAQDAEDSAYTTTAPTAIGSYVVKAVIPTTYDYKESVVTAEYEITAPVVNVYRYNADQSWTQIATGAFASDASYDTLNQASGKQVSGADAMASLFADATVTYNSNAKIAEGETFSDIYDILAIKVVGSTVHVDVQMKDAYVERLNKDVEYYLKKAGFARPQGSTGDSSNYYVLYGTGTTTPTAKSGMTEVGMEDPTNYIENQLVIKPEKTADEFVTLLQNAGYSYDATDVERLGLTIDWYRFINTNPMHVDGDIVDAAGIAADTYYPVYVYQRVEGQDDAYLGVIKVYYDLDNDGVGYVTDDQLAQITPAVDGYNVTSIVDEKGNDFSSDSVVEGKQNIYITLTAIPAQVTPVTPVVTPTVPVVVAPVGPAPVLPTPDTTPAAAPAAGAQAGVAAQAAQPAVQEEQPQEIVEEQTPLASNNEVQETTLEDEEAPLAAAEDNCIIHIIVLILTVLAGVYNIVRAFARKRENEDAVENKEA